MQQQQQQQQQPSLDAVFNNENSLPWSSNTGNMSPGKIN
jgi:hypothetical protein